MERDVPLVLERTHSERTSWVHESKGYVSDLVAEGYFVYVVGLGGVEYGLILALEDAVGLYVQADTFGGRERDGGGVDPYLRAAVDGVGGEGAGEVASE